MDEQLKQLGNLCYPEIEVESFLSQYPMAELVPKLVQQNQFLMYYLNFFQFLSKHEKFHKMVLFSDPLLVEQILYCPDQEVRQIISTTLKYNSESVYNIIIQSDRLPQYINVLFYLLNDDTTNIALQTQAFFYYITKKNSQFYQNELVYGLLEQGVQNKDESQMRNFDIIVEAINQDQNLMKIYKNQIDFLFSLYQSEDLLTQLNAIQLLSHFAANFHNSELIKNSEIFQLILNDCFNQEGELLKKSLILVLLGKMIANNCIKMDIKMKNNFLNSIKSGFNSKNNDEVATTLEIIGFLCQLKEGISLVASDKNIFQIFIETSYSLNQNIRQKFLNALRGLFLFNPQKNVDELRQVFYCIGNLKFASQLNLNQVEKSIPEDEGQSLKRLLSFAYTPYEDLEKETLAIMLLICEYPFGIKELIKSDRIPDYIGREFSRDKEIFDLKKDLLSKIKQKAPQFIKNDKEIKQFEERYREAINSKLAQTIVADETQ